MNRRIILAVVVGLFVLAPFAYAQEINWSRYSTDELIQQRHQINMELQSRLDKMTPEERQQLIGRQSTLKTPFQSPREDVNPDVVFQDEWLRRVRALPRDDQPKYIMPPDMISPRLDTPPEVAK
jgi:hypothetical protein